MKLSSKKAKKLTSLAVATALVIPIAMVPSNALKNDYANHWAKTTIQKWVDMGYVKGVGNQGVLPNKKVSRAEFVRLANQRYGYTKAAEKNNFTDVVSSKWFYNDVLIAQEKGYISGLTPTIFGPNATITREQAIAIVSRILGLKDNEESAKKFSDASSISSYARGAVGALVDAKIISGYEDGTIRPKRELTRAEAMIILEKVSEKISEKTATKDVVKSEYTIELEIDGKIQKVTVKHGEKLAKPADPKKSGYVFDGWYVNGKKFDFNTPITKDMKLVAKFSKPSSGGGGGGGGGSTKPSTPKLTEDQAKELVDNLEKAISGKDNEADVSKTNIQGIGNIDYDSNKTIAENLKKYSNNIATKISQDTKGDSLNTTEKQKLGKIYTEAALTNLYTTEARFNEKVATPLNNLGLNEIADAIKTRLAFAGGNLTDVNMTKDGSETKVIESIINNFDKIADAKLEDLQKLVHLDKVEQPYYKGDSGKAIAPKYELELTLDGTTVTITRDTDTDAKRDELVKLIYDFAQKLNNTKKLTDSTGAENTTGTVKKVVDKKAAEKFLSEKHNIKLVTKLERTDGTMATKTLEKTLDFSISAKNNVSIPVMPVELSSATTVKQVADLGIKGLTSDAEVDTLKSLKSTLVSAGVSNTDLEAGKATISLDTIKAQKDKFTKEQADLLVKLIQANQ